MTSFNLNYCGLWPKGKHQTHMLDPDEDGNVVCVRPGCGHVAKLACICRMDPGIAKYIGCPTHTENPRVDLSRYGTGSRRMRACWPWLPIQWGGHLTVEQADAFATLLVWLTPAAPDSRPGTGERTRP